MLSVVFIAVGVVALFAAVVPVFRAWPEQQQLGRQLKYLRWRDRQRLTSSFLRREPVPDQLSHEADALARLHWSQRYTVLSMAGLALLMAGLVISDGQLTVTRWLAVVGGVLAAAGGAATTRGVIAGHRYLHRRSAAKSGPADGRDRFAS